VIAKTRIVLCDDHPILLAGLRKLLESENDLELVGEATSGLAALRLIRATRPDIAILDISMPELNGVLLTRRLTEEQPATRLMILTVHEDRAYLKQALEAGVRGYVLKRSAAENLVQAIRAVMAGGVYVDPALTDRVLERSATRSGRAVGRTILPELTERETEVLKLTAFGFTTKETALRLDVGVKSIETYKARGLEKLGLKTRAELVRYASAQGWLADL
jgi:DNA-binding NarL/FixJ family response regulator